MRLVLIRGAVLAALLSIAVVSPAVGGPSLASLANTAKKALSTAKKANTRATNAQRTADSASDLAESANTNATSALARGQITEVTSGRVPFTGIAQGAQAFCPAGQRVISGGGASISDEQLAASAPNSSRTGWFVIGVDLYVNGGEYVEAIALCAPSGQAVAASRGAARAELAAKVRQARREAAR